MCSRGGLSRANPSPVSPRGTPRSRPQIALSSGSNGSLSVSMQDSAGGQPMHHAWAKTKLKRTFLQLTPPLGTASSRFKILQWNILADGLAQNGDFVKVGVACGHPNTCAMQA